MTQLQLPDCSALIATALDEDFAYGPDHTSIATVPAAARCSAELNAREDGTIAGLGLLEAVLNATASRLHRLGVELADDNCEITLHGADGQQVCEGQTLATITANTRLV